MNHLTFMLVNLLLSWSNCMLMLRTISFPIGPTYQIHWSMKHARTIKWNLTPNATRPNPQGSYHYGTIPVTRTIFLANLEVNISGKLRYIVNHLSYINTSIPLKIVGFYIIFGVFSPNSIKDTPPSFDPIYGEYVEFIFHNNENTIQSWHIDSSDFWTVGFGSGVWNSTLRKKFYNLNSSTTRHTMHVYTQIHGVQYWARSQCD